MFSSLIITLCSVHYRDSIKYRGTLYGTICKLEYDILYMEWKIKSTKRKLGISIYDALLVEDGKVGAGTVSAFEKARQEVQTLVHEVEHKRIEMARLAATGEGETVSKPGSPRPNTAGGSFFNAASKKKNLAMANAAVNVAKENPAAAKAALKAASKS